MFTNFILFVMGCGLGWGYHWLHHRTLMLDMQAELEHANSTIETLSADNADLILHIESTKSPWG